MELKLQNYHTNLDYYKNKENQQTTTPQSGCMPCKQKLEELDKKAQEQKQNG